jgi:hypothetical protein
MYEIELCLPFDLQAVKNIGNPFLKYRYITTNKKGGRIVYTIPYHCILLLL